MDNISQLAQFIILLTIIYGAYLIIKSSRGKHSEEEERIKHKVEKYKDSLGSVLGAKDEKRAGTATVQEETEEAKEWEGRRPEIVMMENSAFNPRELRIKTGTTVVWANKDSELHNLRSVIFNSPDIPPTGSFSFRFENAGTFDYFCGIHPEMKGRIIVGS